MSARFVFVRRRCVVAAFIFALVILAPGAVAVAGVGACLFQVGPVGAHVKLEVRACVVAGVGRMFISGCGRCGAHVHFRLWPVWGAC